MPPKVRYTREQIAEYAFDAVREEGIEALTARALAKGLGISTAPLFTAFTGIDEIRDEVINRAYALYCTYIAEGMKSDIPFKGAGLGYIRFAKDEPRLFNLLFMSPKIEEPSHFYPAGDDNAPAIIRGICRSYGLSEDGAKKLYNHLSVYVHGVATLYARGRNVFTDEDVSRMLSELFNSIVKEIKDEKCD